MFPQDPWDRGHGNKGNFSHIFSNLCIYGLSDNKNLYLMADYSSSIYILSVDIPLMFVLYIAQNTKTYW